MTEITYRPFEPTDTPAIHEIINDAFYTYRYAKAPKLHSHLLHIFLLEFQVISTYCQVAVRADGTVVGILLGRVQGQPPLPGRAKNRLRLLRHYLALAATGFKERKTLMQHFGFVRANRELRRKAGVPVTDELTLFAVGQNTRGLGVGRTLYQNYQDHLRTHERSEFFLYTDSLCSIEFYESRGMRRAAAVPMTLNFRDGTGDLEIFAYLYTGRVRNICSPDNSRCRAAN